MGWIILMVLAIAICGIAYGIGKAFTKSTDPDDVTGGKWIMRIAIAVFIVWVVAATGGYAIKQIPAGKVGVVYQFADIVDQTDEGLQIIAPWRTIKIASWQIIRYGTDDIPQDVIQSVSGSAGAPPGYVGTFSSDTQDVYIKATLNMRVDRNIVQELYRNVGSDWDNVLVAPRIANFLKEETVKYETVDVAPNRESIRTNVRERLAEELAPHGVTVVEFLIDNLDFNTSFKTSIEDKQIAKQKALEETARVEAERQIGLQELALAEGKAQAVMITADAQAYANEVLAESLRNEQEVLAFKAIEKIVPGVQVMLLPAGQEFILDLDSMGLGVTRPVTEESQLPQTFP